VINTLPNLAKVATADLVEKIGGSGFSAAYINWARTVQLLREHAPGWMPEAVAGSDGLLHRAPVGAYLLIRFRHLDGTVTPEVPQAVMDTRNAAIPYDKITARDITDTQRRGVCMAAAFTFGLAYELWAKIALESGYHAEVSTINATPTLGAWDGVSDGQRRQIEAIALTVGEYMEQADAPGAVDYIERQQLPSEHKIALWTLLDSKTRSALKKAAKEAA